ncbi:MAG: hypothetical protein ACR2ND_14235 [Solirubrobacteraceae bacterium]
MNTENISRDDWIIGGVALLLIIDLLFLPWFSLTVGPFSASSTATGDPDGWLGILAVLFALALIADLAIERFSPQSQVPAVSGSRTQTRFVLACVAAVFVVLKFLFHIHFSLFGFGFWAGIVLAAALIYVALQARGASVGAPGGV